MLKHNIPFHFSENLTPFHFITHKPQVPSFLISCRLVQQIIDAVLVLNIDDPPCAIAAVALLFVLAVDVSTS